jgi:hypothetical protein
MTAERKAREDQGSQSNFKPPGIAELVQRYHSGGSESRLAQYMIANGNESVTVSNTKRTCLQQKKRPRHITVTHVCACFLNCASPM